MSVAEMITVGKLCVLQTLNMGKRGKDKNTGPQNFKSQGPFDPSKLYMGIAVKNLGSRAVYLSLIPALALTGCMNLGN